MAERPDDVSRPVNRFIAGTSLAPVASTRDGGGRRLMARSASLLAFGIIIAVGFASGARVAVGTGFDELAREAAPRASQRTQDRLRGSLWIPSGSTAARRALDPRPVMWLPPSSTARSDPMLRARQYRSGRLRIAALDH